MALGEFEALCGFRSPAASAADLAGLTTPLAQALHADLTAADPSAALRSAMTRLLTLPADQRATLVTETAENSRNAPQRPPATCGPCSTSRNATPATRGPLQRSSSTTWCCPQGKPCSCPPGNVHAYLHGVAVEVMATSDNVLRAGLTTKHVDPEELLKVLD